MSKTPFMPLWVNDFIGDTLHLDAKEVGAYMLILMTMWGRDGTLPNDHSKLKRVARVGRDWSKVWASIEGYFKVEGDVIFNERLRQEFLSVAAKRKVNAQSGARGGHAKALKDKEAALANASKTPQRKPTISEPESEDTNVSILRDAQKPEKPDHFQSFWNTYPHRNGAKKGRAKAEASYSRHFKAGISEQDIIDGAKRYSRDRQVVDGYAKDPTTWLNQRGWEDDIEPTSNSQQSTEDPKARWARMI